MSTVTTYSQGTPCWPQLINANPDASVVFYEKVLGWLLIQTDSGSFQAFKDDALVAELVPSGSGPSTAFSSPAWITYLAVDELSTAVSKVSEGGGKMVVQPYTFGQNGAELAIALDPEGAAVGLWQAIENQGASLANQPGAFIWNQYNARALPEDLNFYQGVAGIQWRNPSKGPKDYFLLLAADRVVGGSELQAADKSPVWDTYFAVESLDDALASVDLVGGSVVVPAFEDPGVGTIAGVQDPNGAFFYLVQPLEQMSQS